MADQRRLPQLTDRLVSLDALVGDDPVWRAIADIAARMRVDEWVLIGGQMVALHGFIAGTSPPRATTDIDIVADVLVRAGALGRCVDVLTSMHLEGKPSITDRSLHRFVGERATVDLVVPDHLPKTASTRIRGYQAVPVVGGQRALDRATRVAVNVGGALVEVVVPDLRGAIVLKARAAVVDWRDNDRHLTDIAFLCGLVLDPLGLSAELDAKERASLRRVDLPDDPRMPPWVRFETAIRLDAVETWRTLRAVSRG